MMASKSRRSIKKIRSALSVPSSNAYKEESNLLSLDVISVDIFGLQLTNIDSRYYAIKATFCDQFSIPMALVDYLLLQILLSGIVRPIDMREVVQTHMSIAHGTFSYSPADIEKMGAFANTPLIVSVQPLKTFEAHSSEVFTTSTSMTATKEYRSRRETSASAHSRTKTVSNISTCNIDILPIFQEHDSICVKKRLEPAITPSVLHQKSFDNQPLITLKVSVMRDPDNAEHNDIIKDANSMKITVVGLYNMLFPYDKTWSYTVATKMPAASIPPRSDTVIFTKGRPTTGRFDSTNFFPKWESLRASDEPFTNADEKFTCNVHRFDKINAYDVDYYFRSHFHRFTTIWGSFHRSLILKSQEKSFRNTFRRWKWPVEITMAPETGFAFNFMANVDLFQLCYPGVRKVCVAVPLSWFNHWAMKEQCNCENLVTGYDKAPSSIPKNTRPTTASSPARSTSSETGASNRPTGGDDGAAFIIIEISLARALLSITIPPEISKDEIQNMLEDLERISADKRMCTARGQLLRDWQTTVRLASNALRRVPHYGTTEFCMFNRQLSETRTRVEVFTSCWQDAAVYVNNNFVVEEFLKSEDMYEEMLLMSHACLMKFTNDALLGISAVDIHPKLKAARHARHMQDMNHAMELYMVLVAEHSYNADYWRELSTCMKEIDREWATYCLDKALLLDIRHPLTLLSKACMVSEEEPDAAEPFFMAILAMYPFWHTGWIAANAYFLSRELFHMADQVLVGLTLSQQEVRHIRENEHPRHWEYELGDWWEQAPLLPGMSFYFDAADLLLRLRALNVRDVGCQQEVRHIRENEHPRHWAHELGDWWEQASLLPGMSFYFDAADLLLRLRALNIAEVCVARSLLDNGPSAAYYYFLGLCCRLQNRIDDALCHTKQGLEQFGEVSFLRNLEGECYHKQHNIPSSLASFEKAGNCMNSYNVLLSLQSREQSRVRSILVDLLRRQPNAYAWMTLADDWIKRAAIGEGGDGNLSEEQRSAMTCATACAIQALKWDRRAGRAWAHLAVSVLPSARRLYCRNMAIACGHYMPGETMESASPSKQSLCFRTGAAYLDCACSCTMCATLHL